MRSILFSLMTVSIFQAEALKVILLTHVNELSRVTNTGKLLKELQNPQLEFSTITWRGRDDNENVEKDLDGSSVLLWTDSSPSSSYFLTSSSSAPSSSTPSSSSTYILIDGTWQEAEKIYRKGPNCLRKLPRLSLATKV